MVPNQNPFLAIGRPDRRAVNLERQMRSAMPVSKANLSSTEDVYGSLGSQRLAFGLQPYLVQGCIIDVVAYCHFYKVQIDRGGVIGACDMQHLSMEVTGAKPINTYVPGTIVWLMWHPHMSFAIILGAAPNFMISPLDALSDMIVQGSRVGLNVDAVHNFPFQLPRGGGIVDWSSGRPFDSIHAGEWGAITETGLTFFLDPAMLMMRVDEETGVFGFYDDQYLRVAGHNLNLRAAGLDHTLHDDENEFNIIEGSTPYLWEAHGAFNLATLLYRSVSDQDVQQNTPYLANTEPAVDNQQPIHRFRRFGGYLGQGSKRTLFILPDGATGLETMDAETKYIGAAEENWGMDGLISMRSAKGIILAKRALIPQPKRLILDEDPQGDTSTNYKADGVFGSGQPHLVGDIPDPPSKQNLVRASAFLDFYAHAYNWRGLHPFFYHTKDWYMPDETDYPFASEMMNGNPMFDNLKSNQYLDAPIPFTFKVDENYGNIMTFPNDSYIALLEDGGILIGDGYGAEIKLTGGSIFSSCPGDMWNLPGKSSITWAGWDYIARANYCADISSNYKDVRIKAEEKVLIFGGNDICGGVLIESRSPNIAFQETSGDEIVGGIILRAKKSEVLIYASSIDLTLSGAGDSEPMITMNAGAGGEIVTSSDSFVRFMTSAQDVFGGGSVVNEYWADNALINTPLRVNGDLFMEGCLLLSGNITAGGGCTADSYFTLNSTGTDAITTAEGDLSSRNTYLGTWAAEAIMDVTRLQDNTDAIHLEFFFRDSAQYDTSGLVLFESRWQQMARHQSDSPDTWTEHAVVGQDAFNGQQSYPHPGKEALTTIDAYFQEDLNLFQLSDNLMQDRGDLYEHPMYATPNQTVLNGVFTIIKNPC